MDRSLGQFERPFGDQQPYDRGAFNIGRVTRVDYEKGWIDVEWMDGFGRGSLIPLPACYSSTRGIINGMPEIDSIVICGWIKRSQKEKIPIILGYLDTNIDFSNNYSLLRGNAPETLKKIDLKEGMKNTLANVKDKIAWDIKRSKRRKIYPGEINIESSKGAELYLDDGVLLTNNKLNEIEILSADQSIRMTSNQLYTDTQAARKWQGMIIRKPVSDNSGQPIIYPNGKETQIITDINNPINLGGKAFTEDRTEIYEKATGHLHVTEVNAESDITSLKPFITSVMGTVVGNDKSIPNQYGRLLRPQIFQNPNSINPVADDIVCLAEEYNTLSSALQLKMASGTKIDIDKQGHLFTNIAASTGKHPFGQGRSWEANFEGAIKQVVGMDQTEHVSYYLNAKGGTRESLGYDVNGISKEVTAKKALYTRVLGNGNDNKAYYLEVTGNKEEKINGDSTLEIAGNYTITVSGKITEEVLGTKEELYVNDKNNMYGGRYAKIVVKDKEELIGETRKTTISGLTTPPVTQNQTSDELNITLGSRDENYTFGNLRRYLLAGNKEVEIKKGDILEEILVGNKNTTLKKGDITEEISVGNRELKVTTGDVSEEITTGNRSTKVTTGDITEEITTGSNIESIVTGSKEITIKTGDFIIDITAGNIEVKTKTGKIEIGTNAQTVELSGTLTVTVKSGVKLVNSAPQVSIGSIPAQGGVITGIGKPPAVTPSHLDFITGLPLIASKSVSASI